MGPPQTREPQLQNGEQYRESLGPRGLISRSGSAAAAAPACTGDSASWRHCKPPLPSTRSCCEAAAQVPPDHYALLNAAPCLHVVEPALNLGIPRLGTLSPDLHQPLFIVHASLVLACILATHLVTSCALVSLWPLAHSRIEYIRVLEQALRALGYEDVAAALEAASCVVQQPPVAAAFRSAVLEGEYDAALRLLPAVAADERVEGRARFLLLRAKYVELMEAGATAAALQVGASGRKETIGAPDLPWRRTCLETGRLGVSAYLPTRLAATPWLPPPFQVLRHELQPLHVQQQVLHSLAAMLLQAPGATSNGAGSASSVSGSDAGLPPEGRAALLEELQDSLLPSLLIPERRLEELVEQVGQPLGFGPFAWSAIGVCSSRLGGAAA